VFSWPTAWWKYILPLNLCLAVLLSVGGTSILAQEPTPDIEVFVRTGCPHCEAAKIFLNGLRREQPSLHIALFDIAEDSAARQRLAKLFADRGLPTAGVPAFLIGTELIVGFRSADTTGAEIRAKLAPKTSGPSLHPVIGRIETQWFGTLDVNDVGLVLFTVIIGLLDGFNPCAMWVLLFLLSLLVNLRDRWKMALIAGTFVFVSGVIYFAFMAAWLNMFLLIGFSRTVQITLGAIALLAGVVNVKDFFALHHGISFNIPESARPGLYARIRRILQAESLAGALAGIVVVAILVNIIELLCTAGFPALYTQILTVRQLPVWEYYGYLGLYNLAYIFDDGLMVTIAVITLSRRKLQERAGRWLKLTSGLVMAGLGTVLLLQPKWLI